MATVYRAHDRRLDRTVAMKIMHPHLADSDGFVARFRREARAAARLSNPGVVAVYDQGTVEGLSYLVMEFVEGKTLRDLINDGPLSVKEALTFTADILRPLGAAHRAGLVHRDIKPENVLLPDDASVPKVADFGLARAVTEATQSSSGHVLGTVAYLAPEVIEQGVSGPRADVFAVGVVLYEMLTGTQPFAGDIPIHIVYKTVHEDVPAPSTLVPGLPGEIDELVASLTARNPEHRPSDADSALALLRACRDTLEPEHLAIRAPSVHPHRPNITRAMPDALKAHSPAAVSRDVIPTVGGAGILLPSTSSSTHVNHSDTNAISADTSPHADNEALSPIRPVPHAGTHTVSLPIGAVRANTEEFSTNATTQVRHASKRQHITPDSSNLPATVSSPGEQDEGRKTSRRSLIAWVMALLLVFSAAGGGGYWYMFFGPGLRITVPDVRGMSAGEAQKIIESAGLTWGEPNQAYSDEIPQGQVISTNPTHGDKVKKERVIIPLISQGVEQRVVPALTGMNVADAEETLKQAGLVTGEKTQEYSDTVPSGSVISSSPDTGTSVNHDSPVDLVVSQGRQPVSVPDVAGKTRDEASQLLTDAHLSVGTVTEEFSDTVPQGSVISSTPAAGQDNAFKGDSVNLVISKGPEMVAIPDITGKQESEATKILEDAGFTVTTERILGGIFGTARGTTPEAGTMVKRGSTITLQVV